MFTGDFIPDQTLTCNESENTWKLNIPEFEDFFGLKASFLVDLGDA